MNKGTRGWILVRILRAVGLGSILFPGSTVAGMGEGLTDLSLEALMDIQVTSVAKKPQRVSESAAAIHVITQEDIRRSGMNSIPELLRLVPGLDVAQLDANKWSISSRGSNGLYAYKLLVMIDGRSVYTPLFGGVYWDMQDTLLEDIERIEVVRGPGGTLWGANAVNGVINIITKQAQDTQGGLLTAETGSREGRHEGVRYGGKLGEVGSFRIHAKQFDRDGFVDATGATTNDKWHQQRAGFRADLNPRAGDTLVLQGDAYNGKSGQTLVIPTLAAPFVTHLADEVGLGGRYLRADWHRDLANGSDFSLQAYHDHTDRTWATLAEKRDTYDIDFQYRFLWGERHELVWGMGYRRTHDETVGTPATSFFSPSMTLDLFSAFVQDESVWLGDRLHFILGSKFEHNDITGFEYQPNARLLWKTGQDGALWASVSRAVHTPSRVDTGIDIPVSARPTGAIPPVAVATIFGNPAMKSERLMAYEIGYRDKLHRDLSLDITAFYNDYARFISSEAGVPFANSPLLPSYLIVPILRDNKAHGQAWGGELAANWQASERWRLKGSLSLLRMHMVADADSNDASIAQVAGSNPRQQWQLHSYLDLSHDVNFDAAIYRVGGLPSQAVPAFTRLDLRLGWRPVKDLELSIAAQNLLRGRHVEFGDHPTLLHSEIPRGVYVKALWHF